MQRSGWGTALAVIGWALILTGCNGASQTTSSAGAAPASTLQISNAQASVMAGTAYSLHVQPPSWSMQSVGYSIENKPGWATFNTTNGSLTGTPTSADVGTYSNIIISATSGGAASSAASTTGTPGAVTTASTPPFSVTVTPPAASGSTAGAATRPSYNKGNGFFVLNGALYDSNGNLFRIRGVNRLHWDSSSAAGIALSGANTVRWDMDFTRDPATNVAEIQTQGIANRNVPIVGNWTTTCSNDPNVLAGAVQSWVSQAAQWTQLNPWLILNVANEWGPSNSTVWRDSYISAIGQLRAAGYTGPILVDSGGCGQDMQDLVQYSQAVFNADPERNVMFALHMYGGTNDYSAQILSVQKGNPTVITLAGSSATHPFAPGYNGTGNSWSGISSYDISGVQGMTQLNGVQPSTTNVGGVPGAWTITLNVDSTNWPDYTGGGTVIDGGNYSAELAQLAALSQSTGAVYIVGEFGPGNNIGPSPTSVTPGEIISAAEANGIGWLAWAWDDVNLPNCQANDSWFSMTYNCGTYTQPSGLTHFGQDVVLNPTYGLSTLARPASIF